MVKVRWFSLLKRSEHKESKSKALLDYADITSKSIVICQQLEHRHFGNFSTYLEYARYCQKGVSKSHQCFYELIFGEKAQKPYFDVDIEIAEVSDSKHLTINDAKELRRQIVASILKTFDYIKPTDIIVFTSHSSKKYSYHIVVDNWCLSDHIENKIFCEKVRDGVEPRLGLFIDSLVYKTIQQLRIFNCHKYGSDRTKIYAEDSKWVMPEKPVSELHKYVIILNASLINNTSYCKITESLKPPEAPRKKWDGKQTILEKEDPTKCLNLLATLAGLKSQKDRLFPYTVQEVKGSLIMLKRHRPSHCRICDRVHQNENPFLIVVGVNRKVYFNCRRVSNDKKLYIGELGKTDYVDSLLTEDQTESIVPKIILTDAPTFDEIMSSKYTSSISKSLSPYPLVQSGSGELIPRYVNSNEVSSNNPTILPIKPEQVMTVNRKMAFTAPEPIQIYKSLSNTCWDEKSMAKVSDIRNIRNDYYNSKKKPANKVTVMPMSLPSFSMY